MFRLFFEVPYHNKPDLNRIFPDSVHDCSALHVCSFILSILHQGIFSVSAFIVSVIYLSRFKESSRITLHACTWRPLFLTSLLLADKMWEDKPVRNSSLAKLFPVLSNSELNRMESEFLDEIKFNVLVKPDLFCSFCEKLLAEQVHQEISRCVSQSEYAATLQTECGADQPLPAKPANGKLQEGKDKNDPAAYHTNGSAKGGSLGGRQKTPEMAAKLSLQQEAQKAVSLRGTSINNRPHGQVPVAWMDGGPSASAGVVSSDVVAGPPRSQSAGPSASCGRRSDSAQGAGTQQIHPVLAQQLRATSGASAGNMAAAKSASQPPGRSVSVHPLHRNDSKKNAGQAEDVPETNPVQRGHPGVVPTPVVAQQMMRRSLPAKTSAPYVPLPRAPSAGSAGGVATTSAPPPSAGGVPCEGTKPGLGHGSGIMHTSGPPSQRSSHPCGSSLAVAAAAAAAGSGPPRPVNQSPRSPVAITPVMLPGESQQVRAPGQVQQSQMQAQARTAQQVHGQGSSQRSSTPPALANAYGAGQVHPSRGSSPAGGPMHAVSQQPQPARASSAPRVAGIATNSASNVRASSQPMQAGMQMRQAHQNLFQPGSPPAPNAQVVSGGHQGPYGHQQVMFAGNNVRGASPAPGITVAGGMPMTVTRGTIGGHSMQHRNPSPVGLAAPNSPAGTMCMGQVQVGSAVSSSRGRSPPPSVVGSAASSAAAGRAPRAVTPNSLVKGITQGIHAGGVVQRNSLRAGQTIQRPGMM